MHKEVEVDREFSLFVESGAVAKGLKELYDNPMRIKGIGDFLESVISTLA